MMSSGVARDRALDHRAHRRVGLLELGALAVAERQHVQQQRLLDLGRVEQAAAALGRELRVVGQHDRRAEHASSSSASPARGRC